jgi:phosphatidylserine/phosphatidylglycerophosphate/cardiolipin synthase-like enzyme
MKRSRALFIFLLVLIVTCSIALFTFHTYSSLSTKQVFEPAGWRLYFSPNGGSTQAIVKSLNEAKASVLVQAYSFTSDRIAEALVNAHHRGLTVEVILDRSQVRVKRGQVNYLIDSGISVYIDAAHAIAHNKVIVIDDATVITGSFNFTVAAELYNAENLLIIQDKDLAAQYTANWNKHREHSKPYDEWKIEDATKLHRRKLAA